MQKHDVKLIGQTAILSITEASCHTVALAERCFITAQNSPTFILSTLALHYQSFNPGPCKHYFTHRRLDNLHHSYNHTLIRNSPSPSVELYPLLRSAAVPPVHPTPAYPKLPPIAPSRQTPPHLATWHVHTAAAAQ